MSEKEDVGHGAVLVIGGSIAGLLAARALAGRFAQVMVLERDPIPAGGSVAGQVGTRKGTPQARQTHVLLERGRRALEGQMPGLTEALLARGAARIADVSANVRWYYGGGHHKPGRAGFSSVALSRPLLEATIRERVLALPNVRLLGACNVRGLVAEGTGDARRVCGVAVERRDPDNQIEEMHADLVVDAGGRGSGGAQWLQALGYQAPPVEELPINMGYVTAFYRRREEYDSTIQGALVIAAPPGKRLAVLLPQDGERWALTIGGYMGDHAPADAAGFLEAARALGAPEIMARISDAEAVSEPAVYTFPASRRRRYDRLPAFPAGYVVIGDALCSFNPVYGQGMTVAALEAEALGDSVQRWGVGRRMTDAYFARARAIVDACWEMVTVNDLGFEGVTGERTPRVRFFNWYMGRLQRAAQRDAAVSVAFLRVLHMLDGPRAVLRPGVLWRLLRYGGALS